MEVGEAARAQDGAYRGGPLHGDEPVLAQQDVPHVLGAHHPHRGPPEEVSLVDEAVFPALHLQEFPPLDRKNKIFCFRRRRSKDSSSFPPGHRSPAKLLLIPLPSSQRRSRGASPLTRRFAPPYLQHHLQSLPEEGEPHRARGQRERAAGVAAAHAVQVPELDGSQKK